MTTYPTSSPPPTEAGPRKPKIVVGVDGSHPNDPALLWGLAEAEATGAELALVTACVPLAAPHASLAPPLPVTPSPEGALAHLADVERHLGASERVPVTRQAVTGTSTQVLLECAGDAELLVVGKRGRNAVSRMLVGSTSIATAGRSTVPVVVVPDRWTPATRATAPIVVGVALDAHAVAPDADPTGNPWLAPAAAALDFAFEQASRRRVPIIAISCWEVPTPYVWNADDEPEWERVRERLLTALLAPWRKLYPRVEVSSRSTHGKAASVLLDAAVGAQMMVLGRHTGPGHFGGLPLGSTVRGVLHYSGYPVAVVPVTAVWPRAEKGSAWGAVDWRAAR